MPIRTPRALLALVVVASLLGACSGGDDEADDSSTTLVPDTCALLGLDDVSRVTGLDFDKDTAGPNTCTYTSSRALAAVSLSLSPVTKDPLDSLADSRSKCDPGSDVELQASDLIAGGFGCQLEGIPHVVVVTPEPGARKYVLNAGNPNPGSLVGPLLQSMASLLQIAVEHG